MLKKIDKLVSKAFLGPFLLTYFIVEFILLTVFISKYFEDLVGKDLGLDVYGRLFFYFGLNITPQALPLAVLLSSLMAFGNLGEHYEITAIKSAGISLLRLLLPISAYAIVISVLAFLFNNYVVPEANLKAYSLMYDIRQKKPTLDIPEGGFYNGLPDYSIRVDRKDKKGPGLYGLMIYDHTSNRGNVDLILADTGKMYTIYNDTYLVMELQSGNKFTEHATYNSPKREFIREEFQRAKFVFSLESFGLIQTPEELFKTNKVMKNVQQLKQDSDSLKKEAVNLVKTMPEITKPYYDFQFAFDRHKPIQDSSLAKTVALDTIPADYMAFKDSLTVNDVESMYERALNKVRNLKNFSVSNEERIDTLVRDARTFELEMHRKFTLSAACFIMFLIGAPLGAIIKKGGLGVPVLISIVFFLLFYFISITTEKYAREGLMDVITGAWTANFILLLFGLVFLRQARNDSRLFDTDAYIVFFERMKQKYKERKNKESVSNH